MNKYNSLIQFLRSNGFKVQLIKVYGENKHYKNYTIYGKGVCGLLCTDDTPNYYSDCILADNFETFDKYSSSPVQLKILSSNEYYYALLKELKYLGSEEGYEASNSKYTLKFTKEYEKFRAD